MSLPLEPNQDKECLLSCCLVMQVHPHCGDGVEISVLYADSQKGTTEVLHAAEYAVQQAPVRQRVLFFLDHLHTGACSPPLLVASV